MLSPPLPTLKARWMNEQPGRQRRRRVRKGKKGRVCAYVYA